MPRECSGSQRTPPSPSPQDAADERAPAGAVGSVAGLVPALLSVKAGRLARCCRLFGLVVFVGGMLLPVAQGAAAAGGRWTLASPLPTSRLGAVTALLGNGDVLVTSGFIPYTTDQNLADSEIFDPTTDAWSQAAPLPDGRQEAVAAPLSNGDVLVTSGTDNSASIATADSEIYDGTSGSWSQAAPIPIARTGAVAAPLANGGVLVVGGCAADCSFAGDYLADTEIYHPASNSWTAAAPIPGARFGAVAARLGDGDVLVTGGASSTGGYTADTEIYHPSSNSWSQAAPLPGGGVGGVAAPLPNGAVLVTGGVQNFSHDPAASSEIYDSTTHSWTQATQIPTAHTSGVATPLLDGDVLVTSGQDRYGNLIRASEVYAPAGTAPSNGKAPSISGTAQDGRMLRVSTGLWYTPGSPSFGYQWERCGPSGGHCVALSGKNGNTYNQSAGDVGHDLTVVVTATDQEGSTGQATAPAVGPVLDPPHPSNRKLPSISGATHTGRTLSVSNGNWSSPDKLSYNYQWERCDPDGCSAINDQTSANYAQGTADLGHDLTVIVIATDQEGQTEQATATSVGPVS